MTTAPAYWPALRKNRAFLIALREICDKSLPWMLRF